MLTFLDYFINTNGINNARSYLLRGIAKLKLNQKESACLDFSKAGELGDVDAYEAIKNFCN